MLNCLRGMKWLMGGALLAACLSIPVLAVPIPDTEPDTTKQEVAAFDHFLDQHPDINRELRQNPSLVNDPAYRQRHPELGEFLQNHPRVREELRENPKRFMQRERRHERYEQRHHRRRGV